MFERFTDHARRVVVLSQEEAKARSHDFMGTEHILLGLIREGQGLAVQVLESLGISLEAVRDQVDQAIGQGQQVQVGHIPFTPAAKKVLEEALRAALDIGNNFIGTEHILLGLIREGQGVAAQVLMAYGVGQDRVRQQILMLLSERSIEDLTPNQAAVVLLHLGRTASALSRQAGSVPRDTPPDLELPPLSIFSLAAAAHRPEMVATGLNCGRSPLRR